jgi:hypothetical protein
MGPPLGLVGGGALSHDLISISENDG